MARWGGRGPGAGGGCDQRCGEGEEATAATRARNDRDAHDGYGRKSPVAGGRGADRFFVAFLSSVFASFGGVSFYACTRRWVNAFWGRRRAETRTRLLPRRSIFSNRARVDRMRAARAGDRGRGRGRDRRARDAGAAAAPDIVRSEWFIDLSRRGRVRESAAKRSGKIRFLNRRGLFGAIAGDADDGRRILSARRRRSQGLPSPYPSPADGRGDRSCRLREGCRDGLVWEITAEPQSSCAPRSPARRWAHPGAGDAGDGLDQSIHFVARTVAGRSACRSARASCSAVARPGATRRRPKPLTRSISRARSAMPTACPACVASVASVSSGCF